jgi:hypothetical protein
LNRLVAQRRNGSFHHLRYLRDRRSCLGMCAQLLEVFPSVGTTDNFLHCSSHDNSTRFVRRGLYHKKRMFQPLTLRNATAARSEEPDGTNIIDFRSRKHLTQSEAVERLAPAPQQRPRSVRAHYASRCPARHETAGGLNVRFTPSATETLHCREMTRWANSGRDSD